MDDHELVRLATLGDGGAFDALIARHREVALRVAYVVGRDAGEAEDAVQEATIRAARSLSSLRDPDAFRAWFVRVAANEARDRLRRSRRRQALELRLRSDHVVRSEPSSEHSFLRRESQQALLDAVNALSSLDREVIACRFFLGLSESETAAALGCRRGTVKSRQSRAIRRLATALDREEWLPLLAATEEVS